MTAWEGKQVGMEEGRIWLRGKRDEKEIERWMGKGEEEWNRDHSTREMSPMCLTVAVELQGTAVTQ